VALTAKGFRPFFLLGALFAVVIVPLWVATLTGRFVPGGPLTGIVWHAHEMLYGFTAAILAGFLLTAVGNWTARETAVGGWLGALAALWLAGRVAMLAVPGWAGSVIDLAFLPALAFTVARPLWLAHRRDRPPPAPGLPGRPVQLSGGRGVLLHNVAFPVTLMLLWTGNLATHLDAHGVWPGAATSANRFAVHVVVVVILLITGRIVPAFTRNATSVTSIRNVRSLDIAAIGAAALVAGLQWAPASPLLPVAAGVGAAAVVARTWHWGARHTLRDPLLWVLHAGHAWVAVGLGLEAAAPFVPIAPSLALHALTAGAIGMLTLGMMARVALGHTGRPLRVPKPVGIAFAAVLCAAVVRVGGPLLAPQLTIAFLWASAIAWAGGFTTYALVYAPILTGPRVDGRPG